MKKQEAEGASLVQIEAVGGAKIGSERLVALLDPELLGDVVVELSATLGQGTLSLAELANLKDGTVIELDAPLNGHVDLSLNGRLVARGELVSVGDNFGVRITDVLARKP